MDKVQWKDGEADVEIQAVQHEEQGAAVDVKASAHGMNLRVVLPIAEARRIGHKLLDAAERAEDLE